MVWSPSVGGGSATTTTTTTAAATTAKTAAATTTTAARLKIATFFCSWTNGKQTVALKSGLC